MNLREAQHLGGVIVISASALILVARKRGCAYHAEGLAACSKEEVSPPSGFYIGIHRGDVVGWRCKHLYLREAHVMAVSSGFGYVGAGR